MASTHAEQSTVGCQYSGCDARGPEWKFTDGEYCSTKHKHQAKGERLLRHLAQDHRFCGSCYRPRKTVYRPDDADCPSLRKKALLVREAFVGFETLTEFSEKGPHGIECACGTTDSHTEELVFRDGEPWEWWLAAAAAQLRREGQHDQTLDAAELADAYWQHDDLALAVGTALAD